LLVFFAFFQGKNREANSETWQEGANWKKIEPTIYVLGLFRAFLWHRQRPALLNLSLSPMVVRSDRDVSRTRRAIKKSRSLTAASTKMLNGERDSKACVWVNMLFILEHEWVKKYGGMK
jgi:hypothetical protein